MTRLLLRAPKSPFDAVSPERTLARNLVGTNSGNLVFLEAAWKILATREAEIDPDFLRIDPRRADEINERYDAYVVPLANAFRLSYEPQLLRMAALFERLRIPVVILGVGAQSNVKYELGRLARVERSVRRFVRAVLDRSGSIGVRGELTADYLRGLGFRDVEVIGCPSMFLYGPDLRVDRPATALGADARIALNVSPYVKAMGPIVASHVARYPNLVYIAQDLDTLARLLWGESASDAAAGDAIPTHASHPLFREQRVRYYVDPWPWIEDLRSFDFSFGTRIHGNITALLAGTPAVVFAHDSRTLELARYFGIPHRIMREVPKDVDAARLYEEADFRPLNEGHAERFARFRDYLGRHGLRDVFADGEDPTAFDRRIAATSFPPAVVVTERTYAGGAVAAVQRTRHRLRQAVRGASIRSARTALLRAIHR